MAYQQAGYTVGRREDLVVQDSAVDRPELVLAVWTGWAIQRGAGAKMLAGAHRRRTAQGTNEEH
ncbi:hypothetical protein [Streptomyces sp. 8L]|uniref:hypothetical protein n=1 Tax=Streptomyces sp. 8L TaxID=2877242 RepID=UPI001CD3DB97|nr:hypothetical protein [Streptomyces sp. 8L]MCA1220015.1 hypothetical protein [Streptomyces sp. 8L]